MTICNRQLKCLFIKFNEDNANHSKIRFVHQIRSDQDKATYETNVDPQVVLILIILMILKRPF